MSSTRAGHCLSNELQECLFFAEFLPLWHSAAKKCLEQPTTFPSSELASLFPETWGKGLVFGRWGHSLAVCTCKRTKMSITSTLLNTLYVYIIQYIVIHIYIYHASTILYLFTCHLINWCGDKPIAEQPWSIEEQGGFRGFLCITWTCGLTPLEPCRWCRNLDGVHAAMELRTGDRVHNIFNMYLL